MAIPTGVWGENPARVTIHDFESLLQDGTHDGWLTGEAVTAIMRADAALAGAFLMDPNIWTAYVEGGWARGRNTCAPVVPIVLPLFVVITYHLGNHWALVVIDVDARRLHFLDSQENQDRRQQVLTVMERFIVQSASALRTATV